jgi:hypothetical protein
MEILILFKILAQIFNNFSKGWKKNKIKTMPQWERYYSSGQSQNYSLTNTYLGMQIVEGVEVIC